MRRSAESVGGSNKGRRKEGKEGEGGGDVKREVSGLNRLHRILFPTERCLPCINTCSTALSRRFLFTILHFKSTADTTNTLLVNSLPLFPTCSPAPSLHQSSLASKRLQNRTPTPL